MTPMRVIRTAASLLLAAGLAAACSSGSPGASSESGTLNVDFATYNPLSLIIKDQGWLEDELGPKGITVKWIQSAGSNKANEALRAEAVDVGSTAGSAALLARSNGTPIKTILIYSQPEWSAVVVGPDSPIESVEQLRGRRVAATKGTDPYFFLLQSLEANGLTLEDITLENLQHADGWGALQNGSVDAWSGLDPIMAGAEEVGATLIYRNVDFNSYGFLNATESFLAERPDLAQAVVDAYKRAQDWAVEHPDKTAEILADVAGLEPPVAEKVISERSNLDVDLVPGAAQVAVLERIGPIFVDSGDVSEQSQIDEALSTLLDDTFAKQADAARVP